MKKLITEQEVIRLAKANIRIIPIDKGDLVTALAKDKIKELGLKVVSTDELKKINDEHIDINQSKKLNKVCLASDHTGFKMKQIIAKYLSSINYDIIDVGTYNEDSCDYPDYAAECAQKVLKREVDFGLILDATGIPSAITANKFNGIRAATCYNEFSAKSAREHNNANVLVLGAKSLGEETILSILKTWMNTDFAGGRHQRRLDKITAIEKSEKLSKII
ncbi:MAG: ribose 5-phosphate isomerase B [Ignavibacteriae bacterium]|nr:ribose 5-phosphate isomerase B [Ignavibacteriota bacterium]